MAGAGEGALAAARRQGLGGHRSSRRSLPKGTLCQGQTVTMFCSSRMPRAPALHTSTCNMLSIADRVCKRTGSRGQPWQPGGAAQPWPCSDQEGASGQGTPCGSHHGIPCSRAKRWGPGRPAEAGGRCCRSRLPGGRSCPAEAALLCCRDMEELFGGGRPRAWRPGLIPTLQGPSEPLLTLTLAFEGKALHHPLPSCLSVPISALGLWVPLGQA